MNKRILNDTKELLEWADYTSDKETKHKLRETYSILNGMQTKNLTRQTKVKLANIGFRYDEKRFGNTASHDWSTHSKQIDIIDNEILRIGLGQDQPYTARWFQLPIKL